MPNPVVLAKEWILSCQLDKLQVDTALLEGTMAVATKTYRRQKFTSRCHSREKRTRVQRDKDKEVPGGTGCDRRKV